MKFLILFLFTFASLFSAQADEYLRDDLPIKEHMLMMDRHRDAFFAALDDPKVPQEETLVHLEMLRIHFHRLFPKTPRSIEGLDKKDLQRSQLKYQAQMVKALNWTVEMEKAIIQPTRGQEERDKKDQRIKALSHQLNLIVGKGHKDFRD